MNNQYFSYDEHARNCAADDFLGQTKRTINGQPVGQEQITLIVQAIKEGLDIQKADMLLEIACGNGVLSKELFNHCQGYAGADISEYLIGVAQKNFAEPGYVFSVASAEQHLQTVTEPEHYTKLLCYAGLQYLDDREFAEILQLLNKRFPHVRRIYIGNLPNRHRAAAFFKTENLDDAALSNTRSVIGKWRKPEDCQRIAQENGWDGRVTYMPEEFYASYYRFDLILEKSNL